jgi:hypothetical protein
VPLPSYTLYNTVITVAKEVHFHGLNSYTLSTRTTEFLSVERLPRCAFSALPGDSEGFFLFPFYFFLTSFFSSFSVSSSEKLV